MENGKENICSSPFYTLQSLQTDFSNYAFQIHGCASLDKVSNVQFTCEKYFVISTYDNKLFDGMQVFRTVKVFKDLTWEATYAGHKASSSVFMMILPSVIVSFPVFMKIIKMVECCKICQGVENQSFAELEKNIHDVCGKEIGKREEVVY